MLPGHQIPFLRSRPTITIRWKHPAGTVCRTAILHFFASCPAQTAETPCPDTSFTPSDHAFISSYRKDFLIGALSPPNASTRAKANGKAVPGARLAIIFPSRTTTSATYRTLSAANPPRRTISRIVTVSPSSNPGASITITFGLSIANTPQKKTPQSVPA